jgi:cystathionine beta-synthase
MIARKLTDLIGIGPFMEVSVANPNARLFLKLEKFNPGGSMKDRMAVSMVDRAERLGQLAPGGTIVESSSGNTGIGLAIVAAERGYRFIAVVDHHAARDKLLTIKAMGGELHFVSGRYKEDEVAVVERQSTAARLAQEIPNAVFMQQSDNPGNPVGYYPLAEDIHKQFGDALKLYVSCAGTGGSITGVGRRLKALNSGARIVAVEPEGSIIFGGPGHSYYQSGTGTPPGDTIGEIMDFSVVDTGLTVSDKRAFETCRFVAKRSGLLIGGSTGGALFRTLEIIHESEFSGVAVCNVCDGGEKYLQTIFNDEWMNERHLLDNGIQQQLEKWFVHRPVKRDFEPFIAQAA